MYKLIKPFDGMSGFNDDNICLLESDKQTNVYPVTIAIPKVMTKANVTDAGIAFSSSITIDDTPSDYVYQIWTPYSSVAGSAIEPSQMIGTSVAYDLYKLMFASTYVNNVSQWSDDDYNYVSYFISSSQKLEVYSDNDYFRSNIKIMSGGVELPYTNGVRQEGNVQRPSRIYDLNNQGTGQYSSITLILSNDEGDIRFSASKTVIESIEVPVDFNLRRLLNDASVVDPITLNYTITVKNRGSESYSYIYSGESGNNKVILIPDNINERHNIDYTEYYNDYPKKALTRRPNGSYAVRGRTMLLSYITKGYDYYELHLTYRNSEGRAVMTVSYNIDDLRNRVVADAWSDVRNGIIDDIFIQITDRNDICSIDIQLTGIDGKSDILTVKCYSYCPRKEYDTMYFLNNLGGMDSFDLVYDVNEKSSISKYSEYYGPGKDERYQTNKVMDQTQEVTSILLADNVYRWLKELGSSYYTFFVKNGRRVPFVISKMDSAIDYKTNSKTLTFTIDE